MCCQGLPSPTFFSTYAETLVYCLAPWLFTVFLHLCPFHLRHFVPVAVFLSDGRTEQRPSI